MPFRSLRLAYNQSPITKLSCNKSLSGTLTLVHCVHKCFHYVLFANAGNCLVYERLLLRHYNHILPPPPPPPLSLLTVREKGEAVTGYYRILTRYGTYVWLQTRGTMVMDRRTGKPSQLLCMHFIVELVTLSFSFPLLAFLPLFSSLLFSLPLPFLTSLLFLSLSCLPNSV